MTEQSYKTLLEDTRAEHEKTHERLRVSENEKKLLRRIGIEERERYRAAYRLMNGIKMQLEDFLERNGE